MLPLRYALVVYSLYVRFGKIGSKCSSLKCLEMKIGEDTCKIKSTVAAVYGFEIILDIKSNGGMGVTSSLKVMSEC